MGTCSRVFPFHTHCSVSNRRLRLGAVVVTILRRVIPIEPPCREITLLPVVKANTDTVTIQYAPAPKAIIVLNSFCLSWMFHYCTTGSTGSITSKSRMVILVLDDLSHDFTQDWKQIFGDNRNWSNFVPLHSDVTRSSWERQRLTFSLSWNSLGAEYYIYCGTIACMVLSRRIPLDLPLLYYSCSSQIPGDCVLSHHESTIVVSRSRLILLWCIFPYL